MLAPGQRIDLEVFCVEAHRWAGEAKFSLGSKDHAPAVRSRARSAGGPTRRRSGTEVARNNTTLSAENATGSLERALETPAVRSKLDAVRRKIVPGIPAGTDRLYLRQSTAGPWARSCSAARDIARALLPKLLDSYAVDYVIVRKRGRRPRCHGRRSRGHRVFSSGCAPSAASRPPHPARGPASAPPPAVCWATGVMLDGVLVHYGVQVSERPLPRQEHRPRPLLDQPSSRPPDVKIQPL